VSHVGYVLKVFPRLSQTFVVNELRAHAAAGLAVTIFSLRRPKPSDAAVVEPPLPYEVVELPGPDEHLAAQLAAAARARGVTHLHAHFAKLATEVARGAARALALPFTFTAHARDIFADDVDASALAERVADAAAVVTISRFNVEHVERTFGRRAALVYNGLPLEELPFTAPRDRARVVLGVGRLVEKKGFVHLVEACALLVRAGVDVRCEIVGDGEERAALAQRIAALGLTGHVTLLGALSPQAVQGRMRAASVLALPCVVARDGDRDGLPTVLLEAMALGTPCVGTDVTGIPEALADGATGLSVPQGDAAGLADACRRLLDDEELRVRLATAARSVVERRFSSRVNARRLRALWGQEPLRVLLRVSNRRGLGHWMRGLNIARELLALEPQTRIAFHTRSAPPFPVDDPRITVVVAADGAAMDALPPELVDFAPDVIVDDTLPPRELTHEGARHVFVMRRCADVRQAELLADPVVARMDALIVPHTPEDFGRPLPPHLAARAHFVGPIVRRADAADVAEVTQRLGIDADDFCLVSTPGGGGFDEDAARLVELAQRVHAKLVRAVPRLRHVVVLGPNARVAAEPVDGAMVVLAREPRMAGLLARADAVLSAGGYNTVGEIRLAQRPAFFLPGARSHDDQDGRVRDLARRAAERVATTCADRAALAALRANYARDVFTPGNRSAAEVLLRCARS
jgi:glycosyltransferase involved in cell wall biosynthesis